VSGFLSINADRVQVDAERTLLALDRIPTQARGALKDVLQPIEEELLARARAKADNEILRVRTGTFLHSIQGKLIETDDEILAYVWSSDHKAHVLEYGAELPPHEIDPATKHALHFLDGGEVFAAHVHFPGAKLPPHPTIHAAFAEMEPRIHSELIAALGKIELGGAELAD
jgi:hypothetical protein